MKRKSIPSYRKQKTKSGDRAFVELGGSRVYLGAYDSSASREAYARAISEWASNGLHTPAADDAMTVSEIVARYWEHVTEYYCKHGRPTKEQANIRITMRSLCKRYGRTPAAEFGPLALKAVRQSLIDADRARVYINDQIGRIKRLFKWAVENELVPATVHHGLLAVAGLRCGRSGARETDPIRPVADESIDAVQPHVSRQVWALIRLQRLTAMRPGEAVIMRGCDIDTSGELWEYEPSEHKGEHHDRDRIVPLGPKARRIVQEFLKPDLSAYLFSPADADVERRAVARARRKTKVQPSQAHRGERSRRRMERDQRGRAPKDRYTVDSYRRAVTRGCEAAFPVPDGATKPEVRAWRKAHHWHPHQIRHRCATDVRKELGIEAAQIWLGHTRANVTEIYAERNFSVARELARKIG